MPTAATTTYSPQTKRLVPFYRAEEAMRIHVGLADGTYAQGTVLAESATPGVYGAYTNALRAAPTVAPTLTTPTGGALAAGDYVVGYTYVDAAGGETTLGTTATTTAALNDVVHAAALTPLPAGVVSLNWYMSIAAGSLVLGFVSNNDGSALDLALPAAGAKQPPAVGSAQAASGLGVAKGLLEFAVVAASGVITAADETGITTKSTPMFTPGGGHFKTSELTGLDAAAVADLSGSIYAGTLADGYLAL